LIEHGLARAYKINMAIIGTRKKEDLHHMVPIIREKLLKLLAEHMQRTGDTLEKVAERCGTTKVHLSTLRSGRRGKNLTLNITLKLLDGLNEPRGPYLCPDIEMDMSWLKFKEAAKKDRFKIMEKVLRMVDAETDLEPLAATIDVYYKRIAEPEKPSPKKQVPGH
jgi:transcriptional regulator with XRE-family HTH domain